MSEVFNWFLGAVKDIWNTFLNTRVLAFIIVLKLIDKFFRPTIRKLLGLQ